MYVQRTVLEKVIYRNNVRLPILEHTTETSQSVSFQQLLRFLIGQFIKHFPTFSEYRIPNRAPAIEEPAHNILKRKARTKFSAPL